MNKEVIEKLLSSPNDDDFLIGLELIKNLSLEELSKLLDIKTYSDEYTGGFTFNYIYGKRIGAARNSYCLNDNLFLFPYGSYLDFHDRPVGNDWEQYIKL